MKPTVTLTKPFGRFNRPTNRKFPFATVNQEFQAAVRIAKTLGLAAPVAIGA